MKKYEILSPAGSVEQLTAAVNNGCDAVYLGLDGFNARMKAPNFNSDNLSYWVDYCHIFGVKVYVAINTSIKNEEFMRAAKMLVSVYKSNADGVIVTDLALLPFAASLPKPFEIIASTQLNTHDAFGARFLKKLGATTVVCARECNYSQIGEIVQSDIKAECFIHGALCVCQSGQCLFSSMVGGNSGNRGFCAQPCRKLYKVNSGEFVSGGYMLSARDVCGLKNAKKLLDLGVGSFKIEGRNRRPEYGGVTAKVYSEYFAGNFDEKYADIKILAETYNRSFAPCAYLDDKNSDIIYPYAQNHTGVQVGKIKQGKICAELPITKGDGLKVLDDGREVCGGVAIGSGTGFVAAEFSGKVKDGMIVCRTSSVAISQLILSARRKIKVRAFFAAYAGKKAELKLISDDIEVQTESDFLVPCALNHALTVDEIAEQLKKTGDSQYTITDITVYCDNVFMTKSQINELRRQALGKLTNSIIERYNSKFSARIDLTEEVVLSNIRNGNGIVDNSANCLAVICYNSEQISSCRDIADYIIFKPEFLNKQSLDAINRDGCNKVFLDLPSFSDNNYIASFVDKTKFGVVCHNIGQVQMAREYGVEYIAGAGLNIFNDNMAEVFDDAVTFFYSQELTLAEIAKFRNKNGIVFVDGNLVLMRLIHCPFKAALGCACERCRANERLVYTDEIHNNFFISRRKDRKCSFELINGKKLSAVSKISHGGRFCVDFDPCVIAHYVALNLGKPDNYIEHAPYTKGRLFEKIR